VQPLGRLVPHEPERASAKKRRPSRTVAERRLREAEATVERARRDLAELDDDTD